MIGKWRRWQILFRDFELPELCIHVLVLSRVYVLCPETETFARPARKEEMPSVPKALGVHGAFVVVPTGAPESTGRRQEQGAPPPCRG